MKTTALHFDFDHAALRPLVDRLDTARAALRAANDGVTRANGAVSHFQTRRNAAYAEVEKLRGVDHDRLKAEAEAIARGETVPDRPRAVRGQAERVEALKAEIRECDEGESAAKEISTNVRQNRVAPAAEVKAALDALKVAVATQIVPQLAADVAIAATSAHVVWALATILELPMHVFGCTNNGSSFVASDRSWQLVAGVPKDAPQVDTGWLETLIAEVRAEPLPSALQESVADRLPDRRRDKAEDERAEADAS